MSLQTWIETLVAAKVDGPTLTAAANATGIPPEALITIPAGWAQIGRQLKITVTGRISCAVMTPGTFRALVRLGGNSVYDTGQLNLNVAGLTDVPWLLEVLMTVRAIGTSANFMGQGKFQSEAVVGSPANAAGGNGSLCATVTAPSVGAGFDSTIANILDLFLGNSVATGSITTHQYFVESLN